MAKQEVKQVKTIKSREELIEDIINAGKSIINNADSILGNEKYFLNCKVTFIIDRNINNIPTISVQREFVPEDNIDKIAMEEHQAKTKKGSKENRKNARKKEIKN